LILETLTGATLAYLIDNSRRRLPLSDIVHLGLHLCSAIHHLHRRNILHPDLKPSNIVSERRLAKVLDPSVARLPGKGVKGVGTENHMSPSRHAAMLSAGCRRVGHRRGSLRGRQRGAVRRLRRRNEVHEQLERRVDLIHSHRRVPPLSRRQ
jgi:serine/threonine protein kinase